MLQYRRKHKVQKLLTILLTIVIAAMFTNQITIVVRISLGLLLVIILLSSSINSYSIHTVYAHNFIPNDSATFLTRVYRSEVELSLAKDNFPSNVTLAQDHVDNAAEVMNKAFYTDEDIIDDTDFIAKYKKALSDNNSTIHALVLANIVDQVLREYGDAFDIDYDLTNMSNMMIMTPANTTTSMSDMNSSSLSSTSMNTSSMHSNMSENSSSKLVNIGDYQSAQKLSEVAYLIFKNKLLQQQQPSFYLNNGGSENNNGNNSNNNNIISKLEKRMVDLKNSVNDRVSAQELMALVHTQIHPSLQLAYNLRLIRQ